MRFRAVRGGKCRLRAAKPHPPFSFPRKKTGGVTVQKKGVRLTVSGLNKPFASGMRLPARGVAAFGVAIRLDLLLLSAAALPILQKCAVIPVYRGTHQCGERSNAAFGKQSAAEVTSLAPHDSKARLRLVTTRRDSWRSHVHRTYTAQRVQLFKPKTGNGNLSLGGFKGGYSLSRKRVSPFCPFPTSGGENERGSPLLL